MCNDLRTEAPRYPLVLARCRTCDLVQLDGASRLDPTAVFPASYPYRTRHSEQLKAEARLLCGSINEIISRKIGRPRRQDEMIEVLDVGCNDGTFLDEFARHGYATYGIDPTDAVLDCTSSHIVAQRPLDDAFVTGILADKPNGFGVVMCNNVFAHVPDPIAFANLMRRLTHQHGFVSVSNHYLGAVLDGQWDTVYHEHRRYYSAETLTQTLTSAGLWVFARRFTVVHGGSINLLAGPAQIENADVRIEEESTFSTGLHNFSASVTRHVETIRARVRDNWGSRPVILAGVPSRAGTLVGACGFMRADIAMAVEPAGSAKIGGFLPGTDIPIMSDDAAPAQAVVLIGSHHLGEPFIRKMVARYGGPAIVPHGWSVLTVSEHEVTRA
jgi:SAM-dependent methyltransferase